ncbi:MAG: RNA-processing protein, partial [Methanosarcinales archaeon]|nr:RNA-processing protein [Methanosarcinales archaeon]
MADYVKVPMDRLGAVIGPHGDMKRLIEAKSTAVLNIDSESGEIEVQDAKDPIQAMRTK